MFYSAGVIIVTETNTVCQNCHVCGEVQREGYNRKE